MNQSTALPTLVLIHDLLSSPLEFGLIAQILRAREVPFDFIEIPGYSHGSDRAALAWRDWVAAAGSLLDQRYGADAPIVLGGLGAGGALAAALALERRPQRVRGVTLLSPVFAQDGTAVRPSRLHAVASALGLDRWIAVRRREPFGVKNAKTRKWIAREIEEKDISSIGPARLPLRALRESALLHAHVRATLASLPAPLLVLHAADDDVCSLASVSRIIDELGGAARLIALEHSYRMITIDNDRQRVAHELADFIGAPKRSPDAPSAAVRSARPERPARSSRSSRPVRPGRVAVAAN
jgi:carboxylesterase